MFQIRYHIVDDLSELREQSKAAVSSYCGIGGYIEIQLCRETFGFFSDHSLCEDDCGSEYIEYWIEKLLKVLLHFKHGKTYAAFSLLETDECLEFRKKGDQISIRSSNCGNRFDRCFFISEDDDPLPEVAENNAVSFEEFECVVIATTKRFLKEVTSIEPLAEKLPSIQRIKCMLEACS